MNFSEIMICLQRKGIEVGRSEPVLSDKPPTFTVVEKGKPSVLRERDFLEYAASKGCLEAGIMDALEITKNKQAQQKKLCDALHWKTEDLETVLQPLSYIRVVNMRETGANRSIAIARSTHVTLLPAEKQLYAELKKYLPHT
ncbi:MAG: hypothetical protein ABSF91_05090 [Bacteroidota bacterium]|jgi:hypothetical protein